MAMESESKMRAIYNDDNIKELFDDLNDLSKMKKKMQRIMQVDLMKKIKRRFNELSSSPNFWFVVSKHLGKCESLEGDFEHKYLLVLTANYRLIISPNTNEYSPKSLLQC